MGAIFEGCEQVLIWLGDSNEDKQAIEEGTARLRDYRAALEDIEDSEVEEEEAEEKWDGDDEAVSETSTELQAFALLYILSVDKHMHELRCFTIRANSMLGVAKGYERAFDALQRITEMQYWRRMWVVQELVLPPVATIVWGAISVPWKIFVSAAENFEKHNSGCCIEHNNSPGLYFNTLRAFNFAIMSMESTRIKRQAAHNLDIFELLNSYFDREATDPKDKVYALLGLVTWHGESRVEPNYKQPTAKLDEDLTVHIINSTKNLRVLVGDSVHHIDFPSWVPNWGQQPESGIREWGEWKCDLTRLNRYHHYAATNTDGTAQQLANSMLKVGGNRVDTIIDASTLISFKTWEESLQMCMKVLSWIIKCESSYVKAFGSVGIWEDFYWRVLCGDMWQPLETGGTGAHRRIQTEDRGAYELWKAFILDDRQRTLILQNTDDNARFQCFHASVCGAITNRRFFVTREGYLGLGPNALQAGNEVYVINGSNVPFVLKKSDCSNLDRQPEDEIQMIPFPIFRLIGDCYVHTIMDGEVCQNGGDSAIPFVLF